MTRLVLPLSFVALLFSACSGSSNGSDPSKETTNPTVTAMKIDEPELRSKDYTLRAVLNFGQADSDRYTAMAGTHFEHEVVSYYYAFDHQRRITKDQIAQTKSFCSVYIETNSGTVPEKAEFAASERLLKGQLTTASQNGDSVFALQLQAQVFKSFFLKCKNVSNSAGALEHIGNILDIK